MKKTKWYINECYLEFPYPVVTITRRLFFSPGGKRYVRHVKHFNSFGEASRHLEKLKKQGFVNHFSWWITNTPIED